MFRGLNSVFTSHWQAVAPLLLGAAALLSSGCSDIAASAASGMADNLSVAILDQEDPELVREGIPAFMLLLDSVVQGAPDNAATLGAAAELYAIYGTAFVADPQRAKILTSRGRAYGLRALCAEDNDACGLESLTFEDFAAVIDDLDGGSSDALFSYSISYLAYIRANSDSFGALTGLPKVEYALQHLLKTGAGRNVAAVNMYLGILNTLRPPALGGKPEVGRQYFETALELTQGQDLSVKVEYARGYARLVYNRELHDQLLNEVLLGEVRQPGLTLANSLAQQQAQELLASADDYF